MASEAFRSRWGWPSGANPQGNRDAAAPRSSGPAPAPTPTQGERQRQRHYRPRTCRICLEVVYPTTDIDESLAGRVFSSKARVRYVSEDPELGRLMSPCRCKGSQKYVHEGCLRAWRNAAPLSDRNYWRCPTCHFEYRLERLRWGRWLSSKVLRAALTVAILLLTVFVLGFVADPIIGFWEDPFGSLVGGLLDFDFDFDFDKPVLPDEGPGSWSLHFLKGFLSLGLLGFLKTMYLMSPWHWFNIRFGGYRRRRGTGRDRLQQINWGLVLIGVLTFLGATWKFVNHLTAKALEKASDRVVDVQEDDPDDDEADDVSGDAVPETATNELKKDR
ncbi:hypothetical protein VTH06DRAFT_1065 [Thermothelomyces fergusii]